MPTRSWRTVNSSAVATTVTNAGQPGISGTVCSLVASTFVNTTGFGASTTADNSASNSSDPVSAFSSLITINYPGSEQLFANSEKSAPRQLLTLVPAGSYISDSSLPALRYQDVSLALSEMRGLDESEHWKLDEAVYGASVQVAATLMDKNIPTPTVFSHGPKSVVFNWTLPSENLYLTVSANRISALLSTADTITHRAEITGPLVSHADRFFSALGSIPLLGPVETYSPSKHCDVADR
jgi:hypothetical protein